MQRRCWFLLVVFVLGTAFSVGAPVANADSGWVLYTNPSKRLSVRFPGKPIETEHDGQTADGPVHVTAASFIDGDHALTATGNIYPAGTKLEVKAALDGALDTLLAKLKGRVVAQKPLELDGFQGRDIQFEAPGPYNKPLRGTARIYASANPPAAFIALAVQMDGKPDPNAQKFFDSLHLGKKVESK